MTGHRAAVVVSLFLFVGNGVNAQLSTDRSVSAHDRDGVILGDHGIPIRPNDEAGCLDGRTADYILRHGIAGRVDPESLLEAMRVYQDQRARGAGTDGVGGTVWTSIGPNNNGGRMTSIAPHPTTAGTLLVGAAGGGVWRTTDSGATWSVLTDSVGNLAVGAVAYIPSDPTKIYVGTGENAYNFDGITGIGLLYSSDSGAHWTLPSSVIAQRFFRISVNPGNPLEIVAATSSGLLRSTNGQNGPWTNPATIPHDSSGALKAYGDVTDLVRDPSNSAVLYATTYDRGFWCDLFGCGNPNNWFSPRVMKSVDGGATWSESSSGLPTSSSSARVSRMSIAIAPSSPSTLYAAFDQYGANSGNTLSYVYKSTNGGASWSPTALSGVANANGYLGTQSWYDNAIVVSPVDPNTAIAGGVYYVKTTDGGATWTTATLANIHVDCHDLRYDNANTLFVANDGGVFSSTDNGSTTTNRNANLVTEQFYTLAMDAANRNRMFGGLQDNGTQRRPDAAGTNWDFVFGGDGFDCQVNADAPSQVMMSWQGGNLIRSQNATASADSFVVTYRNPPWPAGEGTPFATKVVADPNAPATLYTSTYRLWKSTAFGDGWAPLPTTTTDGSSWSTTLISAIAIAPGNSQIIMVSKFDAVFLSTNGGTSWTQVISGLPPSRNVNSIAIDPTNSSTAYAALAGTTTNSLYYTTNGGASWTARGSGLPLFSAQCVRVDPTDPTTLYCGTDVGVYRSTNSGASWSPFGTGLPAVSVYDVQILKDGTILRAATHGRGVWELTVTSPTNHAPSVSASSTPVASGGLVRITTGAAVTFSGTFSDLDGDAMTAKWVFSDNTPSATATSGGSVSHTFYRPGRYPVTLKVVDSKGGTGTADIDVIASDPADNCSTPIVIPATGPFPYTIAAAMESSTPQASDPFTSCYPFGSQTSQWYSFTPPSTGSYLFSFCGSPASVVLTGYTGGACPSAGNAVICFAPRYPTTHDSTNIDCGSSFNPTLTGGTTYYLELTNYFYDDFGPVYMTIAPSGTGINESTLEVGPAIGAAGGAQFVSITGYNFHAGATVSFGGTLATNVALASPNIITCTTPAHSAGTVDVAVTSGGVTSTLRGGYTYIVNAPAAPTGVIAAATTSTHVVVSWTASAGADSYQIYRSAGSAVYSLAGTVSSSASGTITFDDTSVTADQAYLYKVRALAGAASSGDSTADLATTTIFADDPLVPQATTIKATHITQLRVAANAVRTLAGLSAAAFTDPSPAGVPVKAVHITEVRSALDAARAALGLSALAYAHTLTPNVSLIYAIDFMELRNGVK